MSKVCFIIIFFLLIVPENCRGKFLLPSYFLLFFVFLKVSPFCCCCCCSIRVIITIVMPWCSKATKHFFFFLLHSSLFVCSKPIQFNSIQQETFQLPKIVRLVVYNLHKISFFYYFFFYIFCNSNIKMKIRYCHHHHHHRNLKKKKKLLLLLLLPPLQSNIFFLMIWFHNKCFEKKVVRSLTHFILLDQISRIQVSNSG